MNPVEALKLEYSFEAGSFDVCVVGAGHAGCEAAHACAKLGLKTALFTLALDSLANLPCNPSIGGTSKGQLVREVDALGGIIGKMADKCAVQMRMLNRSKGPAVYSPRAQEDRAMRGRAHLQGQGRARPALACHRQRGTERQARRQTDGLQDRYQGLIPKRNQTEETQCRRRTGGPQSSP